MNPRVSMYWDSLTYYYRGEAYKNKQKKAIKKRIAELSTQVDELQKLLVKIDSV